MEEDKFTKLYTKYHKLMYSIAFQILENHHTTEEAVQEALLRLAGNLEKIYDVDSKKSRNYIAVITKNIAVDMLKKEKKQDCGILQEEAATLLPDILDAFIVKDNYQSLLSILLQLEDTYKETLYLKLVLEYSNDQIAEIQGITKRAVEMRLHRGRLRIQKKLNEE